jgi:predicted PurR-regulated permease PerM
VTGPVSQPQRWRGTFFKAWAIIGVLILVVAFGWIVGRMSSALVPFGIGLLVVMLLRRPVDWLAARMNRTIAVIVCYLVVVLTFGIALTFIVPPVYSQIVAFVNALPAYVQQAYHLWDTMVVHPRAGAGIPDWLQTVVLSLKDQLVAGAAGWSSAIASTALSTGGSIASGAFDFVLAMVIGFFALVDLPRLTREIYGLAPASWRDDIAHFAITLTRVLGGWLKGTMIQSTVVASIAAIGLMIVGLPYALALGVLAGLLNIVPYIGPAIALLLAAAAGLFISPAAAVWAVIAVVVAQQVDALYLAPRILGKQVDLHPLLVVFAFLTGAALFGVVGMVLAVPVLAVAKAMFVFWYEKDTSRRITTEDGVLFRTPKDAGE